MIPKFRVWDRKLETMYEPNELTIQINSSEILVAHDPTLHQFIDYSLMQFTGFKDKNNTEIYEGDIIQHSEVPNPCFSYPFEVMQARTGEWRIDNSRCGTVLAFSSRDELEVIGNIYENPELLEVE